MLNGHMLFRCALLGSALALATLTPAAAGNQSRADMKRMLAVQGKHPLASRQGKSSFGATDPTYTDLHDFTSNANDGAGPGANVTLDDAGNIYGTADFGGTHGDGVVFKLAPDGTQTLLHSFAGNDGMGPDGGVILMPSGTIYGTTGSGGAGGNGVIFKISKSGTYKVLHNFSSNDGSFIRGDLIRDKEGNLYGTALFGGANGDGTVFKYGFDGTFSVLHTFNGADGEFPEHGVVRDRDGNLYGVTAFGGASDNGSVYKLATDGTLTTLHSFTGGDDGGFLYGGLDIDKDGNLYGSTVDGGANGHGTVFKIATDGTLSTIYNFTGGADGGSPEGDMLVAGSNLYSAASEGGDPSCQCGVVYQITAKGTENVLHAFSGNDGGGYSAGVIKNKGTLYGTTQSFGAHSNGVVFSVTRK
ncbi:MAG: hypothetical protein JOZ72_02260 [Alphaproteobacteria bacterium]|nr:hypothetical protein [Alphaproteobacteria bacterium]